MIRFSVLLSVTIFVSACGQGSATSAAYDLAARSSYPTMPEGSMTPGSTCRNPDSYRYPEKVPCCERDVSTSDKKEIIRRYDQSFGYLIGQMNRQDFKIDHLIPLCMGGSNEASNLWPQHKSVYAITDPIEPELCELMSRGRMRQAEAIQIILRVKKNLSEAPRIQRDVRRRLGS